MRALLVTCVDAGIRASIDGLEQDLGSVACDRLQVPGGPLALVADEPQRQAVVAWIELLARFKDVGVVYLVSHEYCLAYRRKLGGFFHDEREVLERDLRAGKKVLEDAVYGIRVECHVVPVAGDGTGEVYADAVPVF